MKKLFQVMVMLLVIVFFSVTGWARPALVCDPQTDALGYSHSYDQAVWVDVDYIEYTDPVSGNTYAIVADLSACETDVNLTIYVKAFGAFAPELGRRLESAIVPFDFLLHSEAGVYILSPTGLRVMEVPDALFTP